MTLSTQATTESEDAFSYSGLFFPTHPTEIFCYILSICMLFSGFKNFI